jgi:hypothetical protein
MITTTRKQNTLEYRLTAKFFEELENGCKNSEHQMYKSFTSGSKNILPLYITDNTNKKDNNEIKLESPFDSFDCAVEFLKSFENQEIKLDAIKKLVVEIAELWGIEYKFEDKKLQLANKESEEQKWN